MGPRPLPAGNWELAIVRWRGTDTTTYYLPRVGARTIIQLCPTFMHGFIEVYEESDKALVLVSIANLIKVVPRKEGAYLHLAVQNARGLPYVVSTSSSYEEVKAKIEAAQ